ncbi:MAG: phosphatase PAP2 family protein [Candidatus Paceibacterota bacterium]|jgi:undecaprenyl-diphosphatase
MNDIIFFFFYNLAHQSAFFDKLIIFLAVYFPFVVVALAGLFLLFHHEVFKAESPFRVLLEKKKEFSVVFFSGFLAYFISVLLKVLFHTLRPFLALPNVQSLFFESGFAFPSGHATFFSAIALSIFFLHKKAGYVFMALALIIGLARITAGVHFPIDILGGFVIGGIVSYLVAYFTKSV